MRLVNNIDLPTVGVFVFADILRCVFDSYSGVADHLNVSQWSHMLLEIGVVGPNSELVYQSDGADVAATPLSEGDAIDVFEHFSSSEDHAEGSRLRRVLRLDDESFADALDALAQRRYPLAMAQEGGIAFEWLLRELEEHVVAMQPS